MPVFISAIACINFDIFMNTVRFRVICCSQGNVNGIYLSQYILLMRIFLLMGFCKKKVFDFCSVFVLAKVNPAPLAFFFLI